MESGLYFHIPFCRSRCHYCHFISLPYSRLAASRYERAVLRELELHAAARADDAAVGSIYFGGGTPSMVPAEHISTMIQACRREFRVTADCEISVETNPGTVHKAKNEIYRRCGVTRISMGAQSFSSAELAAIGRIHSPEMIVDSLGCLKESGFENINLDLMLGLPHQTRESWKNTLETAVGLGIAHVSVYMLDLDSQCPLQALVEKGTVTLPEDDLISDLYLETIEFLSSCGYGQYEISNFSLPGYACRHNLKYWKREPVYGFGLGSHSFDGNARWANSDTMDEYLAAVESGRGPKAWMESVDENHALQETLFLGLRLAEGVDWSVLQGRFGAQKLAVYEAAVDDCLRRGLAEASGDVVRLTPSGMLVSNEIFQQFV